MSDALPPSSLIFFPFSCLTPPQARPRPDRATSPRAEAFRLDDGLGRSRASRRRASPSEDASPPPRTTNSRSPSAARRPGPKSFAERLLESPRRRVGRLAPPARRPAAVSPAHAAMLANRDAKADLLGVLDAVGDRVGRDARTTLSRRFLDGGAAKRRVAVARAGGRASAARIAALKFLDDDLIEAPGGGRDGERTRRERNADEKTGKERVADGDVSDDARLVGGDQRRVLGLLASPSQRLGRAMRASRKRAEEGSEGSESGGEEKRSGGLRTPYDPGRSAARATLGILTGPAKRAGRRRG
jgi:hypothetical protein